MMVGKHHGKWALVAMSDVVIMGVAGCADLLGIPDNPRLVDETAMSSGPTEPPSGGNGAGSGTQGMDPGSEIPREASGTPASPPVVPEGPDDPGSSVASGAPAGEGLDAGGHTPDAANSVTPTPPECFDSETAGPNGNCFSTGASLLSWYDARVSCQARGGGWDLASIRSDAVNRFLGGLITEEAWIGASDANVEGTWFWVNDGARFWSGDGTTGSVSNGAFESWFLDEPNGEVDSNCARLLPALTPSDTPTWADLECFEQRGSVCEGPPR